MSIVAMKKKMEAKRGLSSGGKGFSLNPKVNVVMLILQR